MTLEVRTKHIGRWRILDNKFDFSIDYTLVKNSELAKYHTDYVALEKALDNARSFDGKPMTPHDRKIIRRMLKEYYTYKD